uniref:C2H2-type domain-containing protein n=1 Tax=Setaria viridis TaxID=4556 RepID=A0A4U6TH70_SETVI|nr:hypothetical protein SEVIR_8G108100v2 [Setaria viridis]
MDLVEMPMAHAWHQKHGTGTTDLPVSVACSSDAHSSGEKDEMREAAELFTTLVKRVRKETVKEPSPPSVKTPVCTICNKTFSSYHALGRHKFVHNKQKNSLLGDGAGSSSGTGERCALKYVCRKCSEKFLTRKSLGRHIHKHWREIFKMKQPSARRKNLKPPVPLACGTMQSSGPMVLPTDESMQPPVLPTSANPPTPDFDAVQQQQLANRLGNEIESSCSTAPKILNDTGAALPAPKQISPAVKYAFDLNMFPHDTDGWEP